MNVSEIGLQRNVVAIVGQGFEEVELAMYTDLAGWTALVEGVPEVRLSIASLHDPVRSKHGLRVGRDIDIAEASIGPAVGLPAALAFFRALIGDQSVARIERELAGARMTANAPAAPCPSASETAVGA